MSCLYNSPFSWQKQQTGDVKLKLINYQAMFNFKQVSGPVEISYN